MDRVLSRRISIVDFRGLPEFEPPLEFYRGRIVQKSDFGLRRSVLLTDLMSTLATEARSARSGRAFPSLRCTFGGNSHVFDLCWFVRERLPDLATLDERADIMIPPDLAIEIVTPGQTVAELTRKLRSAIRRGVRLGWLIDAKRCRVHILSPTDPPVILASGDILIGDPILPGFVLPIDDLFGWLTGEQATEPLG